MGGWVKDIIRKGDFLGELDEMSTDRRRGEAFLAALKGEDGRTYQDYVDILEQHRVVKTASHARHLRQHWFPQNWQDPNNTDV